MASQQQLTDQDYELLSAYIDGELSDVARTDLDRRLKSDAKLHSELISLQQTATLLRELPESPVPRGFTINEQLLAEYRTSAASRLLRIDLHHFSLVASFLLVAIGVYLLVDELSVSETSTTAIAGMMMADMAVDESAQELDAAVAKSVSVDTIESAADPAMPQSSLAADDSAKAETADIADTQEVPRLTTESVPTRPDGRVFLVLGLALLATSAMIRRRRRG